MPRARPGNLTALAPAGVRGLDPYVPGKPITELERELGISHSIKLASNENPLGPPAEALAAVQGCLAEVALYPDGSGHELKQAIARIHGVAPGCVTLGNGSNDVLVLLAEALLDATAEAVCSEYAFAIYGLAIRATGATCQVAPANPRDHEQPLGHDLDAMAGRISARTRLVFLANPNNPTGTWLRAGEVRRFLESIPPDVVVVIDEAYAEYVTEPGYAEAVPWLGEFPNLVVTRTFSKIYGLAGLRIGYALSSPEVADLLNRVRQPFNTSVVAQAAALAALGARDHVVRSREVNSAGIAELRPGLAALGWHVPPSAGNFLLADTGGPAQGWYEALLRAGVIVRPMAGYGLPDHLRITVGLEAQNRRLLASLADISRRSGGA